MVRMTAALVADVLAHGLGDRVEIGEDFLDGLLLETGCAGDGDVPGDRAPPASSVS